MAFSTPNRTRVFISYSHKDERFLEQLLPHLEYIDKNKSIDIWADIKIRPGDKWQDEIELALASTKVAILLISKDFLNSEYILSNELPPLLAAAEAEGVKILPIILKPCILPDNLSQFQMINNPSRSVLKMKGYEREELWVKVTKASKEALLRPIYDANSSKEKPTPTKADSSTRIVPQKTKEQWQKEAITYSKARDWINTLIAYDTITLFDPHDAIAHYKKGDALINLKRHEEALVVYRQVIQLDPFNAGVYKKIGDALKDLKRFEEALVAYKQFIQSSPDDDDSSLCSIKAEICINMGDILFVLMRYDEAIIAYDEAIEFYPSSIYFYLKADMLYAMKHFEEALVAYDDALEAGVPWAYEGKAELLYEMERYKDALFAYDRVIDSARDHCDLIKIYNTKGKILFKLKYYEEALIAYNNAIASYKQENEKSYEINYDPNIISSHNKRINDLIDLYSNRGDVLRRLGKIDEAQQSYVQAHYFTAKMGYWIYKDHTNWVARVHRGDSNGPINKICKWNGAEKGKPAPDTWEYVEKLPTNLVIVKDRKIQPTPCNNEKCMNGIMQS